jgi:hypothetical protein
VGLRPEYIEGSIFLLLAFQNNKNNNQIKELFKTGRLGAV